MVKGATKEDALVERAPLSLHTPKEKGEGEDKGQKTSEPTFAPDAFWRAGAALLRQR
jgi:hypothetical protein